MIVFHPNMLMIYFFIKIKNKIKICVTKDKKVITSRLANNIMYSISLVFQSDGTLCFWGLHYFSYHSQLHSDHLIDIYIIISDIIPSHVKLRFVHVTHNMADIK